MSGAIDRAIKDLRQNAADVTASFAGLSAEQLNWKPAEKKWSIAQCLDHLIVTHSLYFPLFENLSSGEFEPTAWQRISPLSGFFGRFLINNLDPANVKPMKTTAKAFPASSDLGADIVDRYIDHQAQLVSHLEQLPSDIDTSTIITSPLMSLVTYSLADTLVILSIHCVRHFNQAKRVMESSDFPN